MCYNSETMRKRKKYLKKKRKAQKTFKQKAYTENEDKIIGVVQSTASGANFLRNSDDDSEYFIPKFCVNTAMHFDTVEAVVLKNGFLSKKSGLQEVCVSRIIERGYKKMTGIVFADIHGLYFKPDNPKLPQKMLFDKESESLLQKDDKVYVEFNAWPDPTQKPLVKLLEIFGKKGEHDAETKAILKEHSFQEEFPEKVLRYAEKMKKIAEDSEDFKSREDFRQKITFTIDPEDAKDFDDAISIHKKEDGGIELGIHIADVSHFLKYNDPVDKEAQKRGTSVYLVDRVIHMLPPVLSADLCSLKEGEQRRAFSVIFDLDKNFEIANTRFAKTIIKSNKRFTYSEAQKILDTGSGILYEELSLLEKIADKLHRQRVQKGFLDFESPEIEFKLDSSAKVVSVKLKERLKTMRIIEELMLEANRQVAEFMKKTSRKNNSVFIYRVHDEPDPEKIAGLEIFLKSVGLSLKRAENNKVDLYSLSKMLQSVSENILKPSIEKATLRSMAKAVYSHKNIGHFSLGFTDYTHFTSPIRRYPDIMVHRLLDAAINNKTLDKQEQSAYINLAVKASMREVEAMQAERESVRLKQLEYMQDRVGQIFETYISGMNKHGFFLLERETLAEGFSEFARSGGLMFFKEKDMLVESDDGKKFRVGDKIQARLKKVDFDNKRIEWEIVN